MGREALAEVAQANRPQSDSERDSLPEMVDAAASNGSFWLASQSWNRNDKRLS